MELRKYRKHRDVPNVESAYNAGMVLMRCGRCGTQRATGARSADVDAFAVQHTQCEAIGPEYYRTDTNAAPEPDDQRNKKP